MKSKASLLLPLLLGVLLACLQSIPAQPVTQVPQATLLKDVKKDIRSPDGGVIGYVTIPAGSKVTVDSVSGDGILINRKGESSFMVDKDCVSSADLAASDAAKTVTAPTPLPDHNGAEAKATVTLATPATASDGQSMAAKSIVTAATETVGKKGVGLSERRTKFGAYQLNSLNVDWYYNWGTKTQSGSRAEFVPMLYSLKTSAIGVPGKYLLGYNEPDNEKQSNISVEDALKGWQSITSNGKLLGSPATARDPTKSEWLKAFMNARPKVDFMTLHWYKGAKPEHFIQDIQALHAAYGLPVWVTEFAPQTAATSAKEPKKYSQQEVDHFISVTTEWMEKTPWVQRYAWHDSGSGTSALFESNGELTETGKAYAKAGRRLK